MKWFKIIPVCLILLGALSCGLKEDLSDCYDCCRPCPPEPPGPEPGIKGNVELTFSYLGDTHQPEMFGQMIDRVTLTAYAMDGRKVAGKTIEKNDLVKFQGTKLDLAPGDYRIVCWGNCMANTEIVYYETYHGARIHHPNFPRGKDIHTNDHLYHGCYDLTVPANEKVSGEVQFMGAHINMEVYVRGANSAHHTHLIPTLKAHRLMPQYNHDMLPTQPFTTTYHPESRYNMGLLTFESKFQVLRFEDDNPVLIDVRETPDSSVHTIVLKDYMAENDIKVSEKNEATVRILVEFTDLGVAVKVPDWEPGEVTPEYD